MRTTSHRATSGLVYACMFFVFAVAFVGAVGIIGARSITTADTGIAKDELATATGTSQAIRDVGTVYATGQELALTTDSSRRTQLAATLYDTAIPTADTDVNILVRIHANDDAAELADIGLLTDQWSQLRTLLSPANATASLAPSTTLSGRLANAFEPLSAHLDRLVEREQTDADENRTHAESVYTTTAWVIIASVLLAVLAALGVGRLAAQRIRRAIEPAEDQVVFADTLQLAENEDEAHRLLQRHLERTVAAGVVTVLNRNNSADRLEAVTALPEGSPLTKTLQHAEPRSCLAVRSGRVHDESNHREALLGCGVCGTCPGQTTCTPLTVGGEVIGSVLIARAVSYSLTEQQQIRDSVGQAAPVLANLRNLAIAELRAATDSLTGLPNKRAVTDTLKRMLAQASRTLTPMSLLLLDRDHFKDINDRFGHPLGDQMLANVGAALRSALRDSDFAGRNGGEEFAVLLPNTDSEGAIMTAEKIREAIADITVPGVDLTVTASVGVATYPEHAISTERLERLADSALYVANRSGRNRVEIAAPPADGLGAPDLLELTAQIELGNSRL